MDDSAATFPPIPEERIQDSTRKPGTEGAENPPQTNSMEIDQLQSEHLALDEPDLSVPLISFAGKDALKAGWEKRMLQSSSLDNALQFIREFQENHCLRHEDIDVAINLVEAAGIPRNLLATDILNNYISLFKQRIPRLSQAQIRTLVDDSFSYLTVPELSAIPIAALDHLDVVPRTIWSQIVQNGLADAPYTVLPLSIKQRIWASEPVAFDHEVDLVLSKIDEPLTVTFRDLCCNPSIEARKSENPILQDLLRLVQSIPEGLVDRAIHLLYTRALDQASSPLRLTFTNLFHDFVIHFQARSENPIIGVLRRCARILSVSPSQPKISDADVRYVFDATHNRTGDRSYILMILGSSYSRDFLADQHLVRLYGHRGEVNVSNGSLRNDAVNHLTSDVTLVQLTSLVLHSIRRENFNQGDLVVEEDVHEAFQLFFPLLINEMDIDAKCKQEDYFSHKIGLPDDRLRPLIVQGKLERRVILTYCLHLFSNNDVLALVRFRLLIDAVAASYDPREEIREVVLANSLCAAIYESK